jgi:hypothetical protein
MRRMPWWIPWLAIGAVVWLLPGAKLSGVHAATRPEPPGTVLYHETHWHGWGWSQTHGLLTTRATSPDADVAPFAPPNRIPYAVQATIQDVGPTYRPGDRAVVAAGFGILVRGSDDMALPGWYAGPVKGMFTGFVSYPCTLGPCSSLTCTVPGTDPPCATAGAGLLWQAFGWYGTRFHPNHRWHTYRLEVRGDSYRLFIDGLPATALIRIPGYQTYRWVGLWSMYYRIKVRDFRVIALAPASLSATDVHTLQDRALTWSDEVGKPEINAQFLSSEQMAYLWHMDAGILRQHSYALSYSQAWGGGGDATRAHRTRAVHEISDSLTAYRTVEGAQWGFAEEATIDRQAKEARAGFQEVPVASVGEDRYAFQYTEPNGAIVMVLDFRRANYVAHLKVIATPGDDASILDELGSLGATVDQRLS